MAMAPRFDRGLSVVALNKNSAYSLSRYDLFLISSLCIYNKLTNEYGYGSNAYIRTLKKIVKKVEGLWFERTLFKLMS